MFEFLFYLQFMTPLLTIPLTWKTSKNRVYALLTGLVLAVILTFIIYIVRGIMFIL